MPAEYVDYADLPKGPPVDAATLAEIQDLMWGYSACVNAHDFERTTAYLTDEAVAAWLYQMLPEFVDEWREPPTGRETYRRTVRDAIFLPNGQVAALTGICEYPRPEADTIPIPSLMYFERVDARWLIAGSSEVEREDKWCDPAYGPDDSLIDPAYWDEVFREDGG